MRHPDGTYDSEEEWYNSNEWSAVQTRAEDAARNMARAAWPIIMGEEPRSAEFVARMCSDLRLSPEAAQNLTRVLVGKALRPSHIKAVANEIKLSPGYVSQEFMIIKDEMMEEAEQAHAEGDTYAVAAEALKAKGDAAGAAKAWEEVGRCYGRASYLQSQLSLFAM
jgi:hypothetical protein